MAYITGTPKHKSIFALRKNPVGKPGGETDNKSFVFRKNPDKSFVLRTKNRWGNGLGRPTTYGQISWGAFRWDGPHGGPDGPNADSDVLDGARPIQTIRTLMRTVRTATFSCKSRKKARPTWALPAVGAGSGLIIFPARAACTRTNIKTKIVWGPSVVS